MAKKKNSIALFEVIQKSRRSESSTDVPKWMDEQAAARELPRSELPARPGAVARPPGGSEPWFEIAGDRLRLSLTYVSCAAVVMGLVVLLAAAFGLGFWAGGPGEAQAPGPRGSLRDRTPMGRHVVAGAGGRTGGTTRPSGHLPQRQPGMSYLVIQAMNGATLQDYQDANEIVAYCSALGEPANVVRYTNPTTGTKKYIVWSLKPFASAGSSEAQAYARKIETLGQRYRQAGGRYTFQQRATRGGRFDPWFLTYR